LQRSYVVRTGIADIAHKKGKDSVIEPFARHLEVLILDAISYLTAFTSQGFFHKLMSGRRPQQRFAEIDQDITKCLSGLTTALQAMQVVEVGTVMEQLQLHSRQNQHLYEAVTDVQRKVDRYGGLLGVRSMSHRELAEFGEELGVRDVAELREEISQCQLRIECGVERATEGVRVVKSAVSMGDAQFRQLQELAGELESSDAGSKNTAADDLLKWRLTEAPVIDRKQLLGTGAFGSVYGGTYRGQPAAFKVPNTNTSLFAPANFPELQREVRLHLKVCACPGVVQILAVALRSDAVTSDPCVVMERAIGSLHDYLHKQKHRGLFLPVINLSLTSKLTLALQVASAMEYISAAGLIHRDIKSSNVLIFYQEESVRTGGDADICAKICDFGLSKNANLESTLDMSSHLSVKGTPSYLAPEAFNVQYSSASDVYAYGVLLNELLTEQLPQPIPGGGNAPPTIFQLRDAVCRDGQRPPLYPDSSEAGDALRVLIQHCWRQLPEDRCNFSEITERLSGILQTALRLAKYGSGEPEVPWPTPRFAQPGQSAAVPPASPPPPPTSDAHSGTPLVPPATSATTTIEDISTNTATAVAVSAVPAVARRSLDQLSVEEVGALMDHISLHALRDVLIAHKVSGMMLQCCDTVEDLLCPEFGLQSRGLAAALLRKIHDWRDNGVPVF
jgi:serine/threonine protein kinase